MVGEATRARVAISAGAGPGEASGAPERGKPRANPNLASRCGAKTRACGACRAPAMANGRCRIHGGTSTGPRTAGGLAKLAVAPTTRGDYSAASWASDRYHWTLAVPLRLLVAARRQQAFLPPDVAARLAMVPAELSAPVLYSQTAKPEITTKTLRSGGRDARGRFTARARAVPRGRAAELEAARADRAALVPWRTAIAAARLARREALAARRAARIENHDKDRMERLPGACLGGCAVGIAAEVGGAETAPGWCWRGWWVGRGTAGHLRSG
ncbi:MAG TPA: HGGxSTG domain-containing protein, partial [Acetobacteraceae bacterium]|nr:HGGxSTG domain-containing protein [Acetobacteraceae bacterium]